MSPLDRRPPSLPASDARARLARAGLLLLLSAGPALLSAQPNGAPTSGKDVLERMRSAYDGRWYHSLTFVQKTTMRRKDGTDTVQTWYESLQHTAAGGTRLRIDLGDPAHGNGVLFTADSTYRVRDGKVVASSGEGNEFLPLIEGVYVQPVERTAKELEPTHVDFSKVTTGSWKDHTVWIVGTSAPSDTTSPQFWVDAVTNVVVRMIVHPVSSMPSMDVRLEEYKTAGRGLLATHIQMFVGGNRQQAEEYSEWKTDVSLDPKLFDASTWSSARHWVTATK